MTVDVVVSIAVVVIDSGVVQVVNAVVLVSVTVAVQENPASGPI